MSIFAACAVYGFFALITLLVCAPMVGALAGVAVTLASALARVVTPRPHA